MSFCTLWTGSKCVYTWSHRQTYKNYQLVYVHINSKAGIIMTSIELAVTDLVMIDGTGLSDQVRVSATVPPKEEVIIMTLICLLHSTCFIGKSV